MASQYALQSPKAAPDLPSHTVSTDGVSGFFLDSVRGIPEPGTFALFGVGLLGLGIVTPAVAINNLYQRKPFALTAIDAGHLTLGLILAGVIIGLFG